MSPDTHRHGSDDGRWVRLRREFAQNLDPGQHSAVLSWASFTAMFTVLRLLTNWVHRGHGPQGGGVSVGGRHFHHYNIGIALLSAVGAVGLRRLGAANALVVE